MVFGCVRERRRGFDAVDEDVVDVEQDVAETEDRAEARRAAEMLIVVAVVAGVVKRDAK